MPHRPMNREQMCMLPPSLDELLDAGHPARFVAEFVDALGADGWAGIGADKDGGTMGAPANHPRALLGVWLYGFMTGVRSSRKLEAACRDQIPYLWLTGCQRPDHVTLWRFYHAHRDGMRKLLKRTVQTTVTMNLVDLAVQAVDGTKVGANTAKGRSYDADGLRRLMGRLERAIADMEAQNETGEEPAIPRLPQVLHDRRALRDQVSEAVHRLDGRDGQKYINLTDKDAVMMETRGGVTQAYNAQAMVSLVTVEGKGAGMLITATDVVNDTAYQSQLGPMIEQAEETRGVRVEMTLADAGYHSGSNLEKCVSRGQKVAMPESQDRALEKTYHKDRFAYDEVSDRYRCPQGQWLRFIRIRRDRQTTVRIYRASSAVCRACPAFGLCTRNKRDGRGLEIGPHQAALRRHRAWMPTEEAKQAYRQRKQLVEPVFGIIKEQQQAQRFLLRGLTNVAAEWALLATAFNLRTLWRIRGTSATWKSLPPASVNAYSAYKFAKVAIKGSGDPLLRLIMLHPQPA